MPEGHVIHRLATQITSQFGGKVPAVSSPQGRFAAEAARVDGAVLAGASAWGKHLFIDFDSDIPDHIIHIHLGLIGKLRVRPLADPVGHVRLRIADDRQAADLTGPQWCRLITGEEQAAAVAKLGADPLRADADPEPVWKKVAASSRAIGDLLLDQALFAGVGNIYRAEVLFRHGIRPSRPGTQIRRREFDAIWDDLVSLMADGVAVGRIDTVRPDHTPEAMGRPPREDAHGGEVYVYRRAGQPCLVCGTPVAVTSVKGRNLFYCPACQR
ncbi:Fpg/Nei family DNA glycosylase [Corynebacterium mendelii]|uniref:DNA-(apurinic or apyrimidinic site) lyase n=1 Tax=Corynebacterium mendelii TaxID=2765362 RepID=A0A939E2T8_9CORY|nr:Fpg/Nei family DNA glycosylase [Corynebacterium mendelii]MBN9644402.1 Fpg/Nei family DNA glycosylase [Corynebacterium mendelii]